MPGSAGGHAHRPSIGDAVAGAKYQGKLKKASPWPDWLWMLAIRKVGLGTALLKDALPRTAPAADMAGLRALLVHAKDESALPWYLNWAFTSNSSDPSHRFF